VDGNSVQDVYDAVSEAVARARAGDGPTLVEALTYRWKGHSKSDKNLYRTREEIDDWRSRDPVVRFEGEVLEAGSLTQSEVDAVRAGAREAVRDAVRQAQAAPDARPETLLDAVYARSEA
jgi:pyruvate dehydrogenase E1 component alpha subunit